MIGASRSRSKHREEGLFHSFILCVPVGRCSEGGACSACSGDLGQQFVIKEVWEYNKCVTAGFAVRDGTVQRQWARYKEVKKTLISS